MRKHLSTIILVAVLLVGLSLLLYPTVSNYWNSLHQSSVIASYASDVARVDDGAYDRLLDEARTYNAALADAGTHWELTDDERALYESTLNVPGTDIMGYIEIPKIACKLPIYHGTGEAELQVGVGHIEGSSLPVGGASTHAVLSGHRGLPRARLLTDLDQLELGDTFTIYVLDETLTYEVDQIRIVEPTELDDLAIVEGADLCTLVTCTPYGVNSHRLLVRGHRVENPEGVAEIRISADAMLIEPVIVAPLVALPILLVLLLVLLVTTRPARASASDLVPESTSAPQGDDNHVHGKHWA